MSTRSGQRTYRPSGKREDSTASQHRRMYRPGGQQSVSTRMREAHARVRSGEPVDDVAAAFGVRKNNVYDWCSKVEVALADERNLRIIR